MAQSDKVRERVLDLAEEAVGRVRSEYSDQGLSVVHSPDVDDMWVECSDAATADDEIPESVYWSSDWTVTFTPKRETQSLLDNLVAPYLADGWVAGEELRMDGGRLVFVEKDGYTIQWGGDAGVDANHVASIGVNVVGPCVAAPENIREWPPQSSPSPTSP